MTKRFDSALFSLTSFPSSFFSLANMERGKINKKITPFGVPHAVKKLFQPFLREVHARKTERGMCGKEVGREKVTFERAQGLKNIVKKLCCARRDNPLQCFAKNTKAFCPSGVPEWEGENLDKWINEMRIKEKCKWKICVRLLARVFSSRENKYNDRGKRDIKKVKEKINFLWRVGGLILEAGTFQRNFAFFFSVWLVYALLIYCDHLLPSSDLLQFFPLLFCSFKEAENNY